ncbi:hypothetical protein LEMLEM_LOCUS22407, partial [Lemmus lemmus]
ALGRWRKTRRCSRSSSTTVSLFYIAPTLEEASNHNGSSLMQKSMARNGLWPATSEDMNPADYHQVSLCHQQPCRAWK